ncbi:PLP-dependent aminotransferase family protein [Actinoplanes sp. NPDC049596]|uniref:aminotransferase-like domain-containing protein n=1 Tax=unclassified Actinoplanes TaxID=2626549 RepID=UPI00342421DA
MPTGGMSSRGRRRLSTWPRLRGSRCGGLVYAASFDLTGSQARDILGEVAEAAGNWAAVARSNGISQAEVSRFEGTLWHTVDAVRLGREFGSGSESDGTVPGMGGERLLQFVERPGVLDLGWGHPLPELLPVEEWAEAGAEAARTFGWRGLAYGRGAGPGPLIDWLAGRGDSGTAAETFVTAGASQGLALVAEVLSRPGDVVLVEAPTYHLALRVLADRGVELVAAPGDADGVVPEALAERVRQLRGEGRRVPMLYLVPTFANPTGRSLPDARRRELVAVARREKIMIVEDDTYRELSYDGAAPASLWRLADKTGVVRLGSFAKTVAPGLRLGWVNAAPGIVDRLADLGFVDSGGGVNHSIALTMAVFGQSGAYDRHLSATKPRYAAQRDALLSGLPKMEPPKGGWFVWMPTPAGISADQLLAAAERRGTSFVPGPRFHVDKKGGAGFVRLSFSHLPPAGLKEAARRLLVAVRDSTAAH